MTPQETITTIDLVRHLLATAVSENGTPTSIWTAEEISMLKSKIITLVNSL